MYALTVVGDADTTEAAASLVEHLSDRGTVGRVTRGQGSAGSEGPPARESQADRTYMLADSGEWVATGTSSLGELLDSLARDCEYAVVEGYETRLPTVVVGDASEVPGAVLAQVASADELDPASVVDSLHETDPYETLESLVARVKRSPDETFSGAIATFTGRVRVREDEDDEPTEYLEFERYDGVAEARTAQIKAELEAREGVYEVLLHHKTGVVEGGEDIVFVVVLAGHRTEAFATVEDGINRLKEEVPLFKKEVTVEDEFWAHTGRPT